MAYNVNKGLMLEAIKGSGGIVSVVVSRLVAHFKNEGLYEKHPHYNTVKKWIDKYVYDEWRDVKELQLDKMESIIIKGAEAFVGDGGTQDRNAIVCAKFYLAKIGRERGWGQKVELEGDVGIKNVPDMSGMTYEQMYKLRFGVDPKRDKDIGNEG